MNEPAKYILEEWDSMCAIANKARQGNCPLIEDEVLVEMHKYVGALDNRIVELEQDVFVKSNEVNAATHRAIEMLLEKDKRIAELEKVMFDLISLSSFHVTFPYEAEKIEQLKDQDDE